MAGVSKYNTMARDVGKAIMILVYTEKVNNEFSHFQTKMKEPESFLKFIKSVKRFPIQWQMEMIKPIISQSWFSSYDKIKVQSSCAANLSIWILEMYEKGKEYQKKNEEKEESKT